MSRYLESNIMIPSMAILGILLAMMYCYYAGYKDGLKDSQGETNDQT